MAVDYINKEGEYTCKILDARKTRRNQVLLELRSGSENTKVCLDTINRVDHRGVLSAILDMIDFKGLIQRPEQVIGGHFRAYLRPHTEFSDIIWIAKEVKNAE